MIKVYMLGGFHIILSSGKELPPFQTQKAASLTAYLITHSHQWNSREFLADMLWPDRPASNARRSLLTALWQIRSTLKKGGLDPDRFIRTTGTHIAWDETENIWLDFREFEGSITASSIPELKKALKLYQGPFLPHLYDDWCLTQRYRLESAHHAGLLKLISLQIQDGQLDEAIASAREILTMDMLNEEAHQALIYCYYQQGNRSAAIEQYQECARLIKKELDTIPSEEMQKLYRNILEEKLPRLPQKSKVLANQPETSFLIPITSSEVPKKVGEFFIGRETELQILSSWWEKQGEICAFIKGANGTGKTRLAYEFVRTLEAKGVLIGWGQGFPSSSNMPYNAFVNAISRVIRQIPEPVRNRLPNRIIRELFRFFPEITEEQNFSELPSDQKFDQSLLFSSVCNLISSIARTQPVLIVYDDFQWASEPSVQLLEYIIRYLETELQYLKHTVKFLFTGPSEMMMPGYTAKMLLRLHHDHLVLDLPLKNLNREEVLRWIDLWSGGGKSIIQFSNLLYNQLKGNPFLISETINALFITGSILKGNNGWEGEAIQTNISHLPIPASIVKQVQNVIRDLTPNGMELVYAAAVTGQVFNILLVQNVTGLDDRSLYKAVDELVQSQLVLEAETGQPYDFEFSNPLYQEAFYNQIPFSRRMRLHHRIAQLIEDEYGESAADTVFHHYIKANEYANAVNWALKASRAAMEHSAFQQAEELLDTAEKYLQQSKVPDGIHGQILEGLYELYTKSENKEKANVYSERLRLLAQKHGEKKSINKGYLQGSGQEEEAP